MQSLQLFLLSPDRAVLQERSVHVPDLSAIWPHVKRLANHAEHLGSRIHVKDASGAIVMMMGVATARNVLNNWQAA